MLDQNQRSPLLFRPAIAVLVTLITAPIIGYGRFQFDRLFPMSSHASILSRSPKSPAVRAVSPRMEPKQAAKQVRDRLRYAISPLMCCFIVFLASFHYPQCHGTRCLHHCSVEQLRDRVVTGKVAINELNRPATQGCCTRQSFAGAQIRDMTDFCVAAGRYPFRIFSGDEHGNGMGRAATVAFHALLRAIRYQVGRSFWCIGRPTRQAAFRTPDYGPLQDR